MRCSNRKTSSDSRAGFTLLEMSVSAVLVVILLGSVTLATRRASDAFSEEAVNEDLVGRVLRTTSRVATHLESAQRSTLDPDPETALGAEDLEFVLAEGWDEGLPEWTPPETYRFEMDPAELDNGLDDDQDGLVDEGQVIWVQDVGGANEMSVVLCKGVRRYLEGEEANGIDDNGNGLIDEAGFCFSATGNVITVRLSCEAIDPRGQTLIKTMETAVQLWN